jgi:hypothetical protein
VRPEDRTEGYQAQHVEFASAQPSGDPDEHGETDEDEGGKRPDSSPE